MLGLFCFGFMDVIVVIVVTDMQLNCLDLSQSADCILLCCCVVLCCGREGCIREAKGSWPVRQNICPGN